MAAIAFSACTKITKENTGHGPFIVGGPAVSATERDASNFIKLRVPMSSTSDTVTLPASFGQVTDFAYKSVGDTDNVLVTYTPAIKRFNVSAGSAHNVDIWLWYK